MARHFSLISGWSSSYPETTGYIVPTFLAAARVLKQPAQVARARRMLDWLVAIQMHDGAFQGGLVDSTPVVPVTFNTGQILIGLAAGVSAFGDVYREPMHRAARWLVENQDADGCWRRFPSPFAAPGEKVYDTHVAWGLLEAARADHRDEYAAAALANVRWALTQQQRNGWFAHCCLTDPRRPLTHTIGYALRGILEAHLWTREPELLDASRRTADGLLGALREDGFLPGRLRADWSSAVRWSCLTGTAQIAICWLLLYRETGDPSYRTAAMRANRFLRRTVRLDGPPDSRGGVKGSFPVDGEYGRFEYLNWAAKFFIDAQVMEQQMEQDPPARGG